MPPLESGKSKEAFEHNVKAELAANKPPKQAEAIAYAQQRKDDASVCDAINKAIELASKIK